MFYIIFIFLLLAFFFSFFQDNVFSEEYYSGNIQRKCVFSSDQGQIPENQGCFIFDVTPIGDIFKRNIATPENAAIVADPVDPSVEFVNSDPSRFSLSPVISQSIPQESYDNVGEPSFATTTDSIFFAGNHYAAKSVEGSIWEYVDPSLDFKGIEAVPGNMTNTTTIPMTIPLFKADQHVEYEPNEELLFWIRQGEHVLISDTFTNVDRLAVSRDVNTWAVFDLIPTQLLSDVSPGAVFDYPDIVLTDSYLYLTTTFYDNFAEEPDDGVYGVIIRFPISDFLSAFDDTDSSSVGYEMVLDRDVNSIAPVDGSSNPMYLGAHLPEEPSVMKLYSWDENTPTLRSLEVPISSWNAINEDTICNEKQEYWWCKANTSSRIRSAWLYNGTINFLWNAVMSSDGGVSWVPYVDSATFNLDKDFLYERKYHIAENNRQWIFAAASPSTSGQLGVSSYYVDNTKPSPDTSPFLNMAFGIFNADAGRWEMMPLIESTASLPVLNEDCAPIPTEFCEYDYNFGDFLTTRPHSGSSSYLWDLGGYIITGEYYFDVIPYFISTN